MLIGLANLALRSYRVAFGEIKVEVHKKPNSKLLDLWRMPPLNTLKPNTMTGSTKIWMGVLRTYLIVAAVMVAYKVVQLAM